MALIARFAIAQMSRTGKASILVQVIDVLQRARKLPVGAARNDLRQLAKGLLRLHRAGVRAEVEFIDKPSGPPQSP